MSLNAAELEIIDHLADAFTSFCDLPVMHPDDADEFGAAIHVAQNIVMARSAVRAHPNRFFNESAGEKIPVDGVV